MLRSIPNKLGGTVALVLSVAILLTAPFTHTSHIRSITFRPLTQLIF
ncbi:hypothetical protein F3A58_23765 [Salmonella enterica subsp. enterica serovar Typhi]|nr:hypothetical protein [Salmonella enterica subsp. enterica serovar Typhi]NRM55279.1 hypothetical protein [Salmonella enterica subsp. enterica serovar Typhi]